MTSETSHIEAPGLAMAGARQQTSEEYKPDTSFDEVAAPENLDIQQATAWQRIRILRLADKGLAGVEDALGLAGVVLLGVIMVWVVANIVARYVFNHPFAWHIDTTEMAFAVAVFFGLAFTHRTGGHVRMDIILNRMRPRAYNAVETVNSTIALLMFALLTVATWRATMLALDYGDVTASARLANWPARLALPIGAFLLVLRLALRVVQHIVQGVSLRRNATDSEISGA